MFINLRSFSRGMHYNTSDALKGPDELKLTNGCNVSHSIGNITKDLGYSQIGAALEAGKDITGLFNFKQAEGTQKMLATVNDSGDDDTQLFYSTGGSWTEATGAETAWANEANGTTEMEALDNYCYFVGWDSTDGFKPPLSLTGTTISDSTNVTNMPGAKYPKRYRDRLYIGNCDISGTAYPYRVYYSTVPSSGTITWTVATNFLDVDYSEWVTGLGENWDRLMIFTQVGAWNYDQTSFKKLWDVGCINHRTIRNSGAYMIWASPEGVWMSTGGRPVNIISKVEDFFKTGTPANYFAEVVDETYYLYIGTVTVDNIAYTNTALIYHIPTATWRIREYVDDIKVFAKYNNSGKMELWHGDDSGEVMKHSKYTDSTPIYADDGSDIKSEFRTAKLDFGIPEQRKRINKLLVYTEFAQGLKLYARVVDRNDNVLMRWAPLGNCKKFINEFTVNPDRGHFLEIRGKEVSSKRNWVFSGMSVDIQLDTTKK